MVYFDTAYIVKCYLKEPGWEKVRALAAEHGRPGCSVYGRMELHAAFHRHLREGNITSEQHRTVLAQFELDEEKYLWQWLPISEAAVTTVIDVYASLPAGVFLRTADALHLATAKVNAAKNCYSNDTRLIEAAGYFGVQAENILQQNQQ